VSFVGTHNCMQFLTLAYGGELSRKRAATTCDKSGVSRSMAGLQTQFFGLAHTGKVVYKNDAIGFGGGRMGGPAQIGQNAGRYATNVEEGHAQGIRLRIPEANGADRRAAAR